MTAQLSGLRPLTDAEREAVTLHLQRVPVPTITMRTNLSSEQIAAAVEQNRLRIQTEAAPRTAPAAAAKPEFRAPATPRAATAPASVPAARPPVGLDDTAEELLAWAEASGQTRPATLAARIRSQLTELSAIRAHDEARSHAQAEVDRLTAELEAAKAALREAGGKTPATPRTAERPAGRRPDPNRREQLAAIRTWAAANGHTVAPLGRIPQTVVDAYAAAHPETGSDR